eukprot:15444850-Alexandrium_andersonii.AAC.1
MQRTNCQAAQVGPSGPSMARWKLAWKPQTPPRRLSDCLEGKRARGPRPQEQPTMCLTAR